MTEPSTPRFERVRRIRFAHCDPAGIVFFPQYLVLFSDLVEDWFGSELGIPYSDILAVRRIGLPTVKLTCEFKAVSRMGDDVLFGLEVARLGNRSVTLNLDCRVNREVRVQVQQVIVTTDLRTHRSAPMPDDVRAAILRFQGQG
jgi:4-hydroxybenzoyl-CoA thioesterase